jgi:hypothetical protein
MIPIQYQVVGEEDYALRIEIRESGEFLVDSGTYTSQKPRSGQLSPAQAEALLAAVKALGIPREHPLPPGATAFEAQLTIGGEGEAATYRFWEGALEEDAGLNRVVRLLEVL